ncbi:hypothetical protein IFM58399_05232 [Aspergillus lentulus]|uniref:uncharacterized protein n=1 Tax=Aspergillus lentulus TaxID=293939 RepID=UPI0013951CE3|nr:uncharacterized protein IFM58399_05232 [Aspergillus lentulus]GFF38429.1 hypothetical protein IFM58399_05232 [Aspergillus lentulus]GFF71564.1 hypothetical protein IFM62136_08116 [Aspergillus lentulus]GFF89277.1 hypothetical protein IFM47457_08095 [Aspergillus lentulus]GFG07413.1 hypothetical protein IFM61392_04843 [Aspergillus lentulus]
MAPSGYAIKLQRGITGGPQPQNPSFICTLYKDPDADDSQVYVQQTEPATTGSQESSKTINESDVNVLVEELYSILKKLPTEEPPGSEDIYGLDTSIMWESDDLRWWNGGPSGCEGGESSVRPTAEQKTMFKRAVDIVMSML